MKNRVLIAALSVVLLLASSCLIRSSLVYFDKDTVGVPNLLTNPGFNAYSLDPGEALLGWTVQSSGNRKVFIDGREAIQGNTSLRIDASQNTVILLSDAFKVSRYGGYYTRLLSRSSLPKGPQITLRFITFKPDGSLDRKFRVKLKTGNTWEKATISAGFLKPGVSFGRVQIEIPPFEEGSLWLDDSGCWEVHRFRID
jgi:hypothetical protein